MPGSIDSLIERQRARYARMRTREFVSLQPRYQEVAYTFDGTVESRPYFLYQVRTLDGRKLFPWRQHNAVTLAAMVRHALDDLHKTSDSDLRSFVMGHVAGERYKSNRLSWVPLPSIGHVHADGRIRRVMLLGPRGSNFDLMKRAVFGMQFVYLTLDRQNVALLTQTDEIEGAVMPYLATSDEWFTITPMVLPGHTTRGRRQPGKLVPQKISRLLIKALAQEGYPEVEDIRFQKAPFHLGSLCASDYRTASHMCQSRLHVYVKFSRPITGPMLAGVGRHYGLGVFAAP